MEPHLLARISYGLARSESQFRTVYIISYDRAGTVRYGSADKTLPNKKLMIIFL